MYLLVYVNDSLSLNWQSKDVIIRTTFFNINIQLHISLTVYLRVSHEPHNKQRLFPWTVVQMSAVWEGGTIVLRYLQISFLKKSMERGDVWYDLRAHGHIECAAIISATGCAPRIINIIIIATISEPRDIKETAIYVVF